LPTYPLSSLTAIFLGRMISEKTIRSTVVELLRLASFKLPFDVKEALTKAFDNENETVPKMQLKAILDNIALAEAKSTPICQDTGIPLFYVTMGDVETNDVKASIREGVVEATKSVPLRPNAVHPLTRKNPGNNIGENMPFVHCQFTKKNFIEITVMPKGAGSENMNALAMLTPYQGIKGIKEFILNAVVTAGGKPCPPTILGIGIGGSSDIAMELSKEALLRPLGSRSRDSEIAKLERELFEAVNELGIGPMGLGGKTTVLDVNIEYAYCHTASLPVALSFQCWAARRATARIYRDGHVEYMSDVRGSSSND